MCGGGIVTKCDLCKMAQGLCHCRSASSSQARGACRFAVPWKIISPQRDCCSECCYFSVLGCYFKECNHCSYKFKGERPETWTDLPLSL